MINDENRKRCICVGRTQVKHAAKGLSGNFPLREKFLTELFGNHFTLEWKRNSSHLTSPHENLQFFK